MKMGFSFLALIVASLAMPTEGLAATKYRESLFSNAPLKKQGQYINDGVILGGKISDGFTLLNVRRGRSKKSRMERIVLDIGDLVGKPAKNEIAYHHISLDKQTSRLVIELNQVARSGVDQAALSEVFKRSPYVRQAEISFDPEDLTTSLILKLKRKTKVEVFNLISPNQPSRIVIDMLPRKSKKKT
jgi:hypothetical protein